MKELLIFICGMIFVSFFYPIADSISTFIQNWFGAKSVELQVKAEQKKLEVDQTPVHAVGFQVPQEPEQEEYWEEEDNG